MKRKIYDVLLNWKREYSGKTAILLEGARRVGKSYIVENFAQKEYKIAKKQQLASANICEKLRFLLLLRLYPRICAIVTKILIYYSCNF